MSGNHVARGKDQRDASPIWWTLGLTVLLAAFYFLPRVSTNPRMLLSFAAASLGLLIFALILWFHVKRDHRVLTSKFVPRKVHYVQFMMHSCIYAYWGWYWREVYHFIPFLLAQVIFAYAMDMLVCWSKRDEWILGFGPIPIVLSTNLFLWFRDDWFFLQFLLIASGILGKEFVKWKREGRFTHIFNPSAFSLCVFSLLLIVTHSTSITWGIEIAKTFHYPPYIYQEIFAIGLIVQALFEVTLVTLSSAASLYLLNLCYTRLTGDYQFIDSNIPVAVFLGLHLLVTDPATSPRKGFGKIVFGALYGAAVFGSYSLLKLIHAPEFYDKLLCVPPLNLSVRFLDNLSDRVEAKLRSLSWWSSARTISNPQRANFAWMAVWVCLFSVMMGTHFLTKGEDHPGGRPAFWAQLCEQGRETACHNWMGLLREGCAGNSSSDCLALGEALDGNRYVTKDAVTAGVSFARACDLGLREACGRLMTFMHAGGAQVLLPACDRGDGASCFIMGSLFSTGQGIPKDPSMAFQLFQKSCESGWPRGCGRLGMTYLTGEGTSQNPQLAIASFERGCQGLNAASCLDAGYFYRAGKVAWTVPLAHQRFQQACDLGLQIACKEILTVPDSSLGVPRAN